MLKYNKKLTYDGTVIKEADSILTLQCTFCTNGTVCQSDCSLFAIFELSNGVSKTLEFVRQGDSFKGRLVITEEDLDYITDNKLYVKTVNQDLSRNSNKVTLKFDVSTIKLNVKRKLSKEIQELTLKIKSLEKRIETITKNHRLLDIKITDYSYIKKGMIPVAIDDKGNFAAAFPFTNTINQVNGVESVDQKVTIKAADIPYADDEVTVFDKTQLIIGAIVQINNALNAVKDTQKDLLNRVQQLEILIETYLENPII